MKRFQTYITLALMVAGAVMFTACNDGYLDRGPLDSLDEKAFYEEEQTSIGACNACYDYINKGMTLDYEYLSDNNLYFSNNSGLENVSAGFHNSLDGSAASLWTGGYAAIRRCNTFLANYHVGKYDPVLRERLAAEVKFLRAYYYAQMISLFGNVQFITTPLSPVDQQVYGDRDPRDEILDFVLSELKEAAEILPVSYDDSDRGHATKGAALSLRARIALFFGKYETAEQDALAVMNLVDESGAKVYQLYSNGNTRTSYYELFRMSAKPSTNKQNREDIFWRPYLQSKIHHNLSRELQLPTTRIDEYIRWSPTKSLVDSYLCTDGLPIDKSPLYRGAINETGGGASYADYWRNRDPRMSQTILAPAEVVFEENASSPQPSGNLGFWLSTFIPYERPTFPGTPNSVMTRTGFYFTKYCEIGGAPNGDMGISENINLYNYDWNDIRIIRYAEVLLIYAEACLEQNKLTDEIIDKTVNELRRRVGMKEMTLADVSAAGLDIRDEIRRERRVELALEGHRYYDILRWRKGEWLAADKKGMNKSVALRLWPDAATALQEVETDLYGDMILFTGRIFNEQRHYLWPIPQGQRDLNKNLSQNSGW